MKKARILLIALPALVLVLGAVSTPVYAHDGSSGGSGTSGSGSSGSSSPSETETHSGSTTSGSQPTTTKTESEMEAQHQAETQFRLKGDELLKKAREDKQNEAEKTAKKEDRQKRCEAHKDGLETKVNNLATNTLRHKSRIDEVYAKALTFKTAHNVTTGNIDALISVADAAKAKAAVSTAALASLKPTVDCNKDSAASDVATFKAAAQQARTDLIAYKNAVKAVLTALENATKQ